MKRKLTKLHKTPGRAIQYGTDYKSLRRVMSRISLCDLTPDVGAGEFYTRYHGIVQEDHLSDAAKSFRSNFALLLLNVMADSSDRVPVCLTAVARFCLTLLRPGEQQIASDETASKKTAEEVEQEMDDVDEASSDSTIIMSASFESVQASANKLLLEQVLCTTIRYLEASSADLRHNCLRLLSKILTAIPDTMSEDILDEEIVEDLSRALIQRLDDKEVQIRVAAVLGLKRLQNVDDPECPVVSKLLAAILYDPSPSVRKIALETVVVTKRTFPYVFMKTKDASDAVRQEAVMVLAKKVSLLSLNRSRKLDLLNSVFLDHSKNVVYAVKYHLLPHWLSECGNDPIKLLNYFSLASKWREPLRRLIEVHIEVQNSSREVILRPFLPYLKLRLGEIEGEDREVLLPSRLNDSPDEVTSSPQSLLNPQNKSNESTDAEFNSATLLPPLEALTPTLAFYWLCVMQHYPDELPAAKDPASGIIVLLNRPTLTFYSDYLKSFFKQLSSPIGDDDATIGNLLLQIGATFHDSFDDFGRRELLIFLKELIPDQNYCDIFLKETVSLFFAVHPRSQFSLACQTLMEIVMKISLEDCDASHQQQIEELMDKDRQLSAEGRRQKAQLIVLQNDVDEFIEKQEFMAAAKREQDIAQVNESLRQIQLEKDAIQRELESNSMNKEDEGENVFEEQDERKMKIVLKFVRCILQENFPVKGIFYDKIPERFRLQMIPQMNSILEDYVIPGINNVDPSVREDALICLGFMCFRSLEVAKRNFGILSAAIKVDLPAIRVACVQFLCDLLIYYGVSDFGTEGAEMVEFFRENLTLKVASSASGGGQILVAVARMFCTQLLTDRAPSVSTLRDLLFLYYSPDMQKEVEFINIVDAFIPPFACSHVAHQLELTRIMVPLLKRLLPFTFEDNRDELFDLRGITRALVSYVSYNCLLRPPPDLIPHAVHCVLARFVMEDILKHLDKEELVRHLVWMLELLNVTQEFEELFDLRDSIFALVTDDDTATVKKIFNFFRRIERAGGSYERAARNFREESFLQQNTDTSTDVEETLKSKGRSSEIVFGQKKAECGVSLSSPMAVSRNDSTISATSECGNEPSAGLSHVTSVANSAILDLWPKGEFFGRYKKFVERRKGLTKGNHPLLYEWGIRQRRLSHCDQDRNGIEEYDSDFVSSSKAPQKRPYVSPYKDDMDTDDDRISEFSSDQNAC